MSEKASSHLKSTSCASMPSQSSVFKYFSSFICTPTNSYRYVGNSFECVNKPSGTIQYAWKAVAASTELLPHIMSTIPTKHPSHGSLLTFRY